MNKIQEKLMQEHILHKFPLFNGLYTEGVESFLNTYDADWLIDDIFAFSAMKAELYNKPFLSITLSVKNNKGALTFTDSHGTVFFKHDYQWTDFPSEKASFYKINRILMLPYEYKLIN